MTQHIKTHFKEKGANSLFANGTYKQFLESNLLTDEERDYLLSVVSGRSRFEDNPEANPFLRFADHPAGDQAVNGGAAPDSRAPRADPLEKFKATSAALAGRIAPNIYFRVLRTAAACVGKF